MIKTIQTYLKQNNVDAYIIYDYAATCDIFNKVFNQPFTTRKTFVIITPKSCVTICHILDLPALKKGNGYNIKFETYKQWTQLYDLLAKNLIFNSALMDISDDGQLSGVNYVDYGTALLVKKYVKNIMSSADLKCALTSRLDDQMLESHIRAAKLVDMIKNKAFAKISKDILAKGQSDEYEICQYIQTLFKKYNLVTDSMPIVAVNANSSLPHYQPTQQNHSAITKGDIVLIDLWARENTARSVYADITWMGYVGNKVPDNVNKVFNDVKNSIDVTLQYIQQQLTSGELYGYQVDDVCRQYLQSKGYTKYILHRTGHNIDVNHDHGNGVNIDNFESHDTRKLTDGICFSLEPGVYTKDFGIREEINVCIINKKPVVTTSRQDNILLL